MRLSEEGGSRLRDIGGESGHDSKNVVGANMVVSKVGSFPS